MKLRILNNSIRMRLSVSEVNAFKEHGRVEMSCNFPNGTQLIYSLSTFDHKEAIAEFFSGELHISMPRAISKEFCDTDLVGMNAELNLQDAQILKILIEKDFKCLTDRDEDESELFPNPNSSHAC